MSSPAALMRASHPGPCLALAVLIVALALPSGAGAGTLARFGVAALTAQLAIGWTNDFCDAATDRRAGRTDKPVATGAVNRGTVALAACLALAVSVTLSFAIGTRTGTINLIMLAPALAYDAGLKRTAWSGLAYVVGFAPIPAFAASLGGPQPSAWTTASAGLLGLGGHFANVLADVDADLATGVRGLPQRLAAARGVPWVRHAALVLLALASCVALVGMRSLPAWAYVLVIVLVVGIAAVGVRGGGRTPFRAAFVIVFVNVAVLLASAWR